MLVMTQLGDVGKSSRRCCGGNSVVTLAVLVWPALRHAVQSVGMKSGMWKLFCEADKTNKDSSTDGHARTLLTLPAPNKSLL